MPDNDIRSAISILYSQLDSLKEHVKYLGDSAGAEKVDVLKENIRQIHDLLHDRIKLQQAKINELNEDLVFIREMNFASRTMLNDAFEYFTKREKKAEWTTVVILLPE